MRRSAALARAAALFVSVLPLRAPAAEPPLHVVLGSERPHLAAPERALDAPAAIVAIWFSQAQYSWGSLARIAVVATTNTALIEMRVGSYGRALTKRALGQFDGVYRMPFLPPLLNRLRYELTFTFIARNPAGVASSRAVTIPVAG